MARKGNHRSVDDTALPCERGDLSAPDNDRDAPIAYRVAVLERKVEVVEEALRALKGVVETLAEQVERGTPQQTSWTRRMLVGVARAVRLRLEALERVAQEVQHAAHT